MGTGVLRSQKSRITFSVLQIYRRKYDAQKVLARFAQTARDEVELEKLTSELVNVVSETMQPTSVSLWLRAGSQQGDQSK